MFEGDRYTSLMWESALTLYAKSKKRIKAVEVKNTSSLQMHGFALVEPGCSSTSSIYLEKSHSELSAK